MFHRVKSEEEESQSVSEDSQSQENAAQEQKENETNRIDNEISFEDNTNKSESDTDSKPTASTSKTEDKKPMSEQEKSPAEETAMAPAAQYQRPATPARPASGYPGAYPGVASASDAADSDRRLTIGPGITMSGEIEACDYLLVEGTVEAALKGANFLEIAESGTFYGTVEINEANIAGRFEGDITVNGRLTISSGGVVTGSISYKEIEIEAGAVLDGKLTPLNAAPASTAKKPSAAKAAKPAPKAQAKAEKQPEPANTDEGLFSKAAAAE